MMEKLTLDQMRELRNVVNMLANNPEILEAARYSANEQKDILINNLGIHVAHSGINNVSEKEVIQARGAIAMVDLLDAISLYLEDGNATSFTIGSSMYPDAETFDFK